MGWDAEFSEPILLPRGKKLTTLRDAAIFITKLPKAEHDADEWQAAMQALMLVADHDGPTMFARIGVMRGLRRHQPKDSGISTAFFLCVTDHPRLSRPSRPAW